MAIFRPGPLAGVISGVVGGLVFAQGRQMQIIRPRPNPIRPGSPLQLAQRRAYAQCSLAWRALSEADRTSWEIAARNVLHSDRLGRKRAYRAFNLFMAVNLRRAAQGVSLLSAFTQLAAYSHVSSHFLDFRYGGPFLVCDVEAYTWYATWADIYAGRAFRRTPQAFYRKPPHLRDGALLAPDTNIHSAFVARWGEPAALEYIYARLAQRVGGCPTPSVSTLSAQIPNEGLNQCAKGDFEASWTGAAAPGWNKDGAATMTYYHVLPFGDTGQCRCVVGAATGTNRVLFYPTGPLVAGVQYRLRFAMAVGSGTVGAVTLWQPTGGGHTFATGLTPAGWIRHDYTWTPSVSDAYCAIIWVTTNPATADWYFDNVDWRTSP